MANRVFRMAGDPPIDFRAVDNGDGTYSLSVAGVEGGGGGVIGGVDDTATIRLSVSEEGVLTAEVIPAYAPQEHTHAQADVEGLTTALDGKADASHTHSIGQVTNLQSALDGKAATSHTHSEGDITGLSARLSAIEARLDVLEGEGA